MVSPLMLILLFIMDLVYLFNGTLLKILIQILSFLSCYKYKFNWIIESIEDNCYDLMFGMKKLDVAGFRRMRTISQMTFETFI